MKKFLLITAAVILAIIALSSLGHIIGMAISLLIVYYSLKQFLKTESTLWKVVWALIGLIGFSGLLGSLPAIAGIAAVYILYTGYKNWNKEDVAAPSQDDDPFSGFDRQWNELENTK
ncbi:flagellar basal body rod protein [Lederbergia citrea]|uniref:Flagellar basal body rod protein n=1 Tax=Lederbergia citrea TaxID=2833581 RepID=A0A942UKM8_9BACI|nr:flagellar basal body rod protein [Lederbergia citrea]MBS4177286.1 flagellar basal body rod protein [Lederbergia citrea]MBS4203949.1 flagellar basal body rod protein [Lederbergia citrea]MBS4221467.1 flagellar basal body rod protein [Lederbergia citrea]